MIRDPVRLPRLLRNEVQSGAIMEAGRLRPASLSVTLNMDPISTADMVLNEDDLPVKIHDLVELYGQNGSLGIFRVANIATTYTKQRKVRLNHALDVFNDAIVPGEDPITGTVTQVLTQLISAQTAAMNGTAFWQLGTVQDTASYTIDNKYDNALDCLKKIAEDEEDYYFTCNFGTFPWTLNFIAKTSDVLTEFPLPRNVENCQVTLDDSELCTRLYLSVDTTTTDEYGDKTTTTHEVHDNTAAQAVWGIVSKKEGISTEDVPNKADWISRYFARCGQPMVQITIDGQEINRLTGEPLDELQLGRICRVALPEYNTVFSERIVSISYRDLVRQPERVTVSLANKRPNASRSFTSLSKSSSENAESAKNNAKEAQKNRYSWKVADKHITDQGTILHAAGLEIDPDTGVWLYASEQGANYALGATFSVQAGQISAKADSSVVTALGTRVSSVELDLDGDAGTIGLKARVQTAEGNIRQAQIDIDGAESAITLKADTVTVDAVRTEISNLKTGVTTASLLRTSILVVGGYGCSWFTVRANNGIFKLLGTYDE